jgi:anti-sigma B factor antagonist
MIFTVQPIENQLIIRLSGDLIGTDHSNSPHAEKELLVLIDELLAGGNQKGILDISEVRFMNSSGMGLLLKLLTRFRNKGGDLFLVQPPDSLRRLMIISKLESVFPIINSVEQAITPAGKS